MGFFYRTIRIVENGIKPAYVFDGKPPELKAGVVRIPPSLTTRTTLTRFSSIPSSRSGSKSAQKRKKTAKKQKKPERPKISIDSRGELSKLPRSITRNVDGC